MAHTKFYVDLQRVKNGAHCTLGTVFWLVAHGQDAPRHAQRLAADVACHLTGYSPLLTLAEGLGEVDVDETRSEAAQAAEG